MVGAYMATKYHNTRQRRFHSIERLSRQVFGWEWSTRSTSRSHGACSGERAEQGLLESADWALACFGTSVTRQLVSCQPGWRETPPSSIRYSPLCPEPVSLAAHTMPPAFPAVSPVAVRTCGGHRSCLLTDYYSICGSRRHMQHLAQSAPIAIVGMAGEFPGASDVEGLWELLAKGLNTVSEVPSTIFVLSRSQVHSAPSRCLEEDLTLRQNPRPQGLPTTSLRRMAISLTMLTSSTMCSSTYLHAKLAVRIHSSACC